MIEIESLEDINIKNKIKTLSITIFASTFNVCCLCVRGHFADLENCNSNATGCPNSP